MDPRRSTYHHGDLRTALLTAALDLLEREGLRALSLRNVARKAGVSPAAPYHHFAGRPALLAALSEHGFALLAAALDRARRSGGDLPLLPMGEAYVRFAGEQPELYHLMTIGLDQEGNEALGPGPDSVTAVIGKALEAYPDVSGESRAAVVIALWGAVHGLAVLSQSPALAARVKALGGREALVATAFDHLAKMVLAPAHSATSRLSSP